MGLREYMRRTGRGNDMEEEDTCKERRFHIYAIGGWILGRLGRDPVLDRNLSFFSRFINFFVNSLSQLRQNVLFH